jgi:hypothetical protein
MGFDLGKGQPAVAVVFVSKNLPWTGIRNPDAFVGINGQRFHSGNFPQSAAGCQANLAITQTAINDGAHGFGDGGHAGHLATDETQMKHGFFNSRDPSDEGRHLRLMRLFDKRRRDRNGDVCNFRPKETRCRSGRDGAI